MFFLLSNVSYGFEKLINGSFPILNIKKVCELSIVHRGGDGMGSA